MCILEGVFMQPVSIFVLAQNDVSPITTAPPAPSAPGAAPAVPTGSPNTAVTTSTQAPGAPGTPGGATRPPESGWANAMPFVMLLVAFAFLFIFQARTTKKERQKREDLYASLKKGDKVQTIGGAIGTIAEVREKEVILKFDDSARIKFVKSAIATVLSDETVEAKIEEKPR